MSKTILRRRLWYVEQRETVKVDQDFLGRDERPLILLGEAGMGKSTLLRQLGDESGFALCTARKLLVSLRPEFILGDAKTLLIDALDEVSARREGDAVDLILARLAELGLPRFILSCRVADWRSATAIQGVADLYDGISLEVHIEALNREDAVVFLAATLGDDRAEGAINHLEAHGLAGLWRNPQTLELVGKVAAEDRLPASKGDLFAEATKLLRVEHRREKAESTLVAMPEAAVLNAAGAGFAALILTGKEAMSRDVFLDEDDAPLAELTALPDAACLSDVVDSRLFEARAPERFTYAHRAIGEFIGARWLANQADTPRKQRRLLEMFNSQSLVPASLRGIHAWLAWHSPTLAGRVIASDPMGVIEYGDADALSPPQANLLLNGLYKVSRDNPLFRAWSDYRAGGLVQPAMREEIRRVITENEVEVGLRLLVLQALSGSSLTMDLTAELKTLLLNDGVIFALRSEAGNRLAELEGAINWPDLVQNLVEQGSENGLQLASEVMNEVGYEGFTDALVIDMVKAQTARSERTTLFFGLERRFPVERLDSLLDGIAAAAEALCEEHKHRGYDTLTDLAFALLVRRFAGPVLAPERLWSWLRPFNSHFGLHRETRKAVAEILGADDTLRRAIQRHVLLGDDDERNVWQRYWGMLEPTLGLRPSEEDIVALLAVLDRDDARWRELVELARHGPEDGVTIRAAGARFAEGDADAEAWLSSLAQLRVPDWQVEREKRERQQDAERRVQWEHHRKEFSARVEGMRAGEFGMVISPAKAYLKLFYDMGDDALDGPGRLAEWLGPDLRDAALAGFEAFLTVNPPMPTAFDIAAGYADGKRWEAVYVIVAALAERMRTGRGFSDLADERIMAGYFELAQNHLHKHAGVDGLDKRLITILRARGQLEETQRAFLEPQIAARVQHVVGLYALLRSEEDADLTLNLGAEWLERFPGMSAEAEIEIVDHLLATPPGRTALLAALRQRLEAEVSTERRLTWTAVAFILDFEATRDRLEEQGTADPELLLGLRARLGGRFRRSDGCATLDVQQLEWAVRTFRPKFPYAARPSGVTSGDDNPYDATEYLVMLINRLGDETSAAATQALVDLRDAPVDGYTWYLRIAAAEQRRKRVEAEWTAPDLPAVAAAVADRPPTTASQLQAVMLEELAVVQAKLGGSDVDWHKDFFLESGSPRGEEDCRNIVLKMLGELPFGTQAYPEGHLANDKRCDILCTLGRLMVPIEVKGQWNKDLWTAADRQLDLLYTSDWRAERGIYLVLWFGTRVSKRLQKPPAGVNLPATAEDLRAALAEQSATTREGRTEIVVLDLTRLA